MGPTVVVFSCSSVAVAALSADGTVPGECSFTEDEAREDGTESFSDFGNSMERKNRVLGVLRV